MTEIEERFWAKVKKTETCWLWTASKRYDKRHEKYGGYGAFGFTTVCGLTIQTRAHRYSWMIIHGPIPKGLCVLHKCDNPQCVNPAHLFLGTKADNNRDMCAKGRHVPGGTYSRGNYPRGEAWYKKHENNFKERVLA